MAEEISFYDVKTKKKFTTSDYRIEDKSGRKFAEWFQKILLQQMVDN